jgi:hypothetical protein
VHKASRQGERLNQGEPTARRADSVSCRALCPALRNHRLIEFGNRKIPGLDDFDLALRRFSSGDTSEVTALRAGKPVKLKVTLGVPR